MSQCPRRLIWIPVVHTQTDLGSLSESVRCLYIRKVGKGQWDQHHGQVEQLWENIRKTIDGLELDLSKVRLYQDGLPCCGQEEKIVQDLSSAGSLNHQILVDLLAKGATLVGTESPELLLAEYQLAQQILSTLETDRDRGPTPGQQELSKTLLDQRDRFIAQRINETLRPGETGLIFLGMLHSLEGLLAPDIQVLR